MDEILLSICIPTYNRGNFLDIALSRISIAVQGFENKVEIIVSDNNSNDNTKEVLEKYHRIFKFSSFKNEVNIGLNHNLLLLIDKYASGKYCWLLGDDDFIYYNSLEVIIPILETTNVDFINFDFDYVASISELPFKISCTDIKENNYCSFEELTSISLNPGNVLFTFISANIFKLDLVKYVDKDYISKDLWSGLDSLFPLSYIYSSLMKDKKAVYLPYSLLTTVIHRKEWNWGLYLLSLKFLPDLLDKYKAEGFKYKYLINSHKLILNLGILNLFQFNNFNIKGISAKLCFLKRFMFEPLLYVELFNIFKVKIKKVINYDN